MNKFQSVVVIRRLKKAALYGMRQNKPKEYKELLRTAMCLRKIYERVI
jgi:hypothetical protein